ncbi:MAG TPA: hypothetical protein VJ799_09850 [Nitrososphaeraceae archaeon]|nr:hypothetical protein [Nitrososphaeraceae archaeon]
MKKRKIIGFVYARKSFVLGNRELCWIIIDISPSRVIFSLQLLLQWRQSSNEENRYGRLKEDTCGGKDRT